MNHYYKIKYNPVSLWKFSQQCGQSSFDVQYLGGVHVGAGSHVNFLNLVVEEIHIFTGQNLCV